MQTYKVLKKQTVTRRHSLYGLEACPLLKSDLSSVDFVTVRFLMKLFNTTNTDIINNCRQYFDVKLPSTLLSDRDRFEKKFAECDNIILQNFKVKFQSQFDSLYLSLS